MMDENQQQQQQSSEPAMYACGRCRSVLFSSENIMNHTAATHRISRNKNKNRAVTTECGSYFVSDILNWMQSESHEGKVFCPNEKCGARIGSYSWSGAQCSCGSWVTPAIQFPKSKVDFKPSRVDIRLVDCSGKRSEASVEEVGC